MISRKDTQPTMVDKAGRHKGTEAKHRGTGKRNSPNRPPMSRYSDGHIPPVNNEIILTALLTDRSPFTLGQHEDTPKSSSTLSLSFLHLIHPCAHHLQPTHSFCYHHSLTHLLLSYTSWAGPQIPLAEMKAVIRFKNDKFDHFKPWPSQKNKIIIFQRLVCAGDFL